MTVDRRRRHDAWSRSRRSLVWIVGIPLIAAVVGIVWLHGVGHGDRSATAVALLGGLAVAGVAAALVLPPLVRRLPLGDALTASAVVAPLGLAAAVAIGTVTMLLSEDDTTYVLVLVGVATAVALVVARAMSQPLAAELDRLGQVVRRVADGDLTARTGIPAGRDELSQLASQLDTLVERLEATERERRLMMESIGHDLRTPLTAVRAATEALSDGLSPDPERYLTAIRRHVDAMSTMVDDLFFLSRVELGELALLADHIDLAELVEEVVDAMRPLAEQQGVSLDASIDRSAAILGSPSALGRLLRNLLDNAVRHAPADTAVQVAVVVADGTAVVEVIDAGEGFPPEFAVSALEPFTRADPARRSDSGGAGLGLAIARGVATAHGGDVEIDPGPGGRVRVRLPALTSGG